MNYFVTGATGFIGRFLVAELLKRKDARIYVLVRKGSEGKFQLLLRQTGASAGQLVAITGDLTRPGLGLRPEDLSTLKDQITHFYHLAAIYDLKADAESQYHSNIEGTRNALQAAEAMHAGCFHHVSSIAVAGTYPGLFREDMFDEATGLHDPYFITKHESEKCVRQESRIPYRIYRPSMVVGHSETGEMDKVDGPYFLFPVMALLGDWLPRWLPLPFIEGGHFNIVPVDFAARALDHIGHQPGLDGQCFHLTAHRNYSLGELVNLAAGMAEAPRFRFLLPNRWLETAPGRAATAVATTAPVRKLAESVLDLFGIPRAMLAFLSYPVIFDTTHTDAALAGTGIQAQPMEQYLPKIWAYWEQHLQDAAENSAGNHDGVKLRVPRIRPYFKRAADHWKWNTKSLLHPEKALRQRVSGKVVMLTGASSGIGALVAHKLAAAGATVLMTARSKDKLQDLADDIRSAGGKADVYAGNLTSAEDCDRICEDALRDYGRVDILINNAGRSIRRSIKFSFDRFHDYERTMQLNYFGSIRMAMNLLPGMLARNEGHIINVSTVGVQANPARFSAYLASKWALEGWSWVAANEFAHTGVRFSTLNYPLVRTPMIAPTKIYDYMPVMSPEKAVDWMLDIIITRNKRKLGIMGKGTLLMYYILPKTSESIVNASYQTVFEQPPAHYVSSRVTPAPDGSSAEAAALPGEHPLASKGESGTPSSSPIHH